METQKNKCGIRHERIRFSKKRNLKEFKFRKYSNNVIKKAKEFDNSMIITILMSPNKRYSTL